MRYDAASVVIQLLRTWLLPPPHRELPTAARLRAITTLRTIVIVTALLTDGVVYATLRRSPLFVGAALTAFTIINVALLALDLALTLLLLRRWHRLWGTAQAICIVLEMLTVVVWVQVTGSVSSYFLGAGLLIVLLYRFSLGYAMGMVAAAALLVLHGGAFWLEELGALKPVALFAQGATALYATPQFRVAAMVSIAATYILAFVAFNALATTFRAKDLALRAARQDLDRARAEARYGRLSGQVLAGAYELQEILGRGGAGEVYQAVRLADGSPVAVKVLAAHVERVPEAHERFRREAACAQRLPRRHVAEVLQIGETEGRPFIVMELLRGESLGARLRRTGRLTPEEVVVLAEEIAHALEAAHAEGVIHRDLKPENVFLVTGGADGLDARLLDFGIARLMEGLDAGLTQAGVLLGSPGYLAPEQARGAVEQLGPPTDVFAFGAVLYRALTGQNAFPARTPASAVHEALHVHPPAPSSIAPDLPPDLDHVLALALAKDPAVRYQSAAELAEDVRRAWCGELPPATLARVRALLAATDAPHTATL